MVAMAPVASCMSMHAQDGPLGSQRVFVIIITAVGMKDFVLIGECSVAILCLTSHREFLTSHTARSARDISV